MTEIITQATHELLLGLNRDVKTIPPAMEIMSQQLRELTQTIGPALGLCGSHVAEWIDAGEDPNVSVPAAMTVIVLPGAGAVPVCLEHFREFYKAQQGPQLLVAQQQMPQASGNGLIVPGR